jgi:hypothetical protein
MPACQGLLCVYHHSYISHLGAHLEIHTEQGRHFESDLHQNIPTPANHKESGGVRIPIVAYYILKLHTKI